MLAGESWRCDLAKGHQFAHYSSEQDVGAAPAWLAERLSKAGFDADTEALRNTPGITVEDVECVAVEAPVPARPSCAGCYYLDPSGEDDNRTYRCDELDKTVSSPSATPLEGCPVLTLSETPADYDTAREALGELGQVTAAVKSVARAIAGERARLVHLCCHKHAEGQTGCIRCVEWAMIKTDVFAIPGRDAG